MSGASQQDLIALTCEVLSTMNEDLPAKERFDPTPQLVIMGQGGVLDSLGIANFIVGVEEAINGKFGRNVALSDQDLMSLFETPSVTVEAFASFVVDQIDP